MSVSPPKSPASIRQCAICAARAWERARARATTRLAGQKPLRALPPGVAATGRGDDGLIVFGGKHLMRPRLQRPRVNGWSAAKERRFLQRLADSCNVAEAARAVSMAPSALYARRALDAVFAERWRQSLETGLVNLEAALVEAAISAEDGALSGEIVIPGETPPPSGAEALWLLSEHWKRVDRIGGYGAKPRAISDAELRAALERTIRIYKRDNARAARKAERAARQARA
jgi:hypothetical protein